MCLEEMARILILIEESRHNPLMLLMSLREKYSLEDKGEGKRDKGERGRGRGREAGKKI